MIAACTAIVALAGLLAWTTWLAFGRQERILLEVIAELRHARTQRRPEQVPAADVTVLHHDRTTET